MGLLDRLFGGGMMRDPVRGTAEVVSRSDHRGRADFEKCRLQLVVTAEDVPATAVEQQALVHRSRWPSPGMTLPATIDRANPSNVRIEWDEVPDPTPSSPSRSASRSGASRNALRRSDASLWS